MGKKLFTVLLLIVLFQISQFPVTAKGAENPIINPSPSLQIPIISDVHINDNVAARQTRFQNALKDYNQIAPNYQAIAIDGDLTDYGTEAQYDRFNQILNENINGKAEKILVMGNHEFYQGVYWPDPKYTDQMFINRFVTKTGMPGVYYDKWIKGANSVDYHFIVLGSEESKATNPNNHDYAVLSDNQYNWLENTLKQDADPNRPIFVFLHEPIDNTVYGSEDWGGNLLDGRLKAILQKYPQVILFSGHLHYLLNHPRSVYQDGFTMVNTGAVAYTLYEGGSAPADFSQGLLVNVYDNHVEIKAREFSNHTWINQYTIPIPYKKTIDDTEKPHFPEYSHAYATAVKSTSASISWTSAADNTQVDKYLVKQNGKVLQTVYNKFWESPGPSQYSVNLSNLTGDTNYMFEITAVDAWKNESADSLTVSLKTDRYKGWILAGTNYYFYDYNTGKKVTGWMSDQGKWYYLDQSGIMQTGWVKDKGKWYFLMKSGAMAVGWLTDNGGMYYLGVDGSMKTGWSSIQNKWYYFSVTGKKQTGWVKSGLNWYYLKASGMMQADWLHNNGSWYYFDGKGIMQTGWKLVAGKWYYFYNNGEMAVNTKIGNCKIGPDGIWIK